MNLLGNVELSQMGPVQDTVHLTFFNFTSIIVSIVLSSRVTGHIHLDEIETNI